MRPSLIATRLAPLGGTVRGILTALAALTLAGCTVKPTYQKLDPDRLLHMAGEEAAHISAAHERLARQLNIANRESLDGRQNEARSTLAEARKTLESAGDKELDDHQRLAGWVSLSELSRGARDPAGAGSALDRAVKLLHDLLPVSARCDYVHGVAREVNALRGEKESAKLIASAGDWAVEIPDTNTRRSALVSFALELLRCGDYEAARKMLRFDRDAGWRSDVLIALADQSREDSRPRADETFLASGAARAPLSPPETREDSPTTVPSSSSSSSSLAPSLSGQPFGKQLDFRSNYYRK